MNVWEGPNFRRYARGSGEHRAILWPRHWCRVFSVKRKKRNAWAAGPCGDDPVPSAIASASQGRAGRTAAERYFEELVADDKIRLSPAQRRARVDALLFCERAEELGREGDYLEGVGALEQALQLLLGAFDPLSMQVSELVELFAAQCNAWAITALKKGVTPGSASKDGVHAASTSGPSDGPHGANAPPDTALLLLARAQELTDPRAGLGDPRTPQRALLRAATLHSVCYYYRRHSLPRLALKALERAIKAEGWGANRGGPSGSVGKGKGKGGLGGGDKGRGPDGSSEGESNEEEDDEEQAGSPSGGRWGARTTGVPDASLSSSSAASAVYAVDPVATRLAHAGLLASLGRHPAALQVLRPLVAELTRRVAGNAATMGVALDVPLGQLQQQEPVDGGEGRQEERDAAGGYPPHGGHPPRRALATEGGSGSAHRRVGGWTQAQEVGDAGAHDGPSRDADAGPRDPAMMTGSWQLDRPSWDNHGPRQLSRSAWGDDPSSGAVPPSENNTTGSSWQQVFLSQPTLLQGRAGTQGDSMASGHLTLSRTSRGDTPSSGDNAPMWRIGDLVQGPAVNLGEALALAWHNAGVSWDHLGCRGEAAAAYRNALLAAAATFPPSSAAMASVTAATAASAGDGTGGTSGYNPAGYSATAYSATGYGSVPAAGTIAGSTAASTPRTMPIAASSGPRWDGSRTASPGALSGWLGDRSLAGEASLAASMPGFGARGMDGESQPHAVARQGGRGGGHGQESPGLHPLLQRLWATMDAVNLENRYRDPVAVVTADSMPGSSPSPPRRRDGNSGMAGSVTGGSVAAILAAAQGGRGDDSGDGVVARSVAAEGALQFGDLMGAAAASGLSLVSAVAEASLGSLLLALELLPELPRRVMARERRRVQRRNKGQASPVRLRDPDQGEDEEQRDEKEKKRKPARDSDVVPLFVQRLSKPKSAPMERVPSPERQAPSQPAWRTVTLVPGVMTPPPEKPVTVRLGQPLDDKRKERVGYRQALAEALVVQRRADTQHIKLMESARGRMQRPQSAQAPLSPSPTLAEAAAALFPSIAANAAATTRRTSPVRKKRPQRPRTASADPASSGNPFSLASFLPSPPPQPPPPPAPPTTTVATTTATTPGVPPQLPPPTRPSSAPMPGRAPSVSPPRSPKVPRPSGSGGPVRRTFPRGQAASSAALAGRTGFGLGAGGLGQMWGAGAGGGGPSGPMTMEMQHRAAAMADILALRRKRNAAAAKIQAAWRGFLTRIMLEHTGAMIRFNYTDEVPEEGGEGAAQGAGARKAGAGGPRTQRGWQTNVAVRIVHASRCTLAVEQAAIVIQSHYTAWRTRMRYRHLRKQRYEWALQCVRAHLRGLVLRVLIARKMAAATRLQAGYRRHLAWRQLAKQHRMATEIQRVARGKLVRLHLARAHRAALLFQKIWRSIRCRSHRASLASWAPRLQAVTRGNLARRQLDTWRHSCHLVGAMLKGVCVRRDLARRHVAATSIQSAWRGAACRKWLDKCRTAALVLQNRWRGWLSRRKLCFPVVRRAVCRLQAMWQGWKVRRDIDRKRRAVQRIERLGLHLIQGRRFIRETAAAIVIQKCWRSHAARARLARARVAACRITATARAFFERRRHRELLSAVIASQAALRMSLALRVAARRRAAAHKVGACGRAIVARSRFLRMRAAATRIQAWWRAARAVRAYRHMHTAAVPIQRAFRGYRTRTMLAVARTCAVTIQRRVRGNAARAALRRQHAAATYIQSIWRRLMVDRKYNIMLVAVQAVSRRWLDRRRFLAWRQAAICIQRTWRARQRARRLKVLVAHVERIQRFYRRILHRRMGTIQWAAALHIQAAWRGYCARKQLWAAKRACVVIQTRVRQHLALAALLRARRLKLSLEVALWNSVLSGGDAAYSMARLRRAQAMFEVLELHDTKAGTRHQYARGGSLAGPSRPGRLSSSCSWGGSCDGSQQPLPASQQEDGDPSSSSSSSAAAAAAAALSQLQGHGIPSSRQGQASAAKAQTFLLQGGYDRSLLLDGESPARMLEDALVLALQMIEDELPEDVALPDPEQDKREAATRVQATWRGYAVRAWVEKQHRAAGTIQRCFRGYQVRDRWQRVERAVRLLQARVRYRKGMVRARNEALFPTPSVEARWWVVWCAVCLRRQMATRQRAATKIQAVWRRWRWRRAFLRVRGAVRCLQARVHRKVLAREGSRGSADKDKDAWASKEANTSRGGASLERTSSLGHGQGEGGGKERAKEQQADEEQAERASHGDNSSLTGADGGRDASGPHGQENSGHSGGGDKDADWSMRSDGFGMDAMRSDGSGVGSGHTGGETEGEGEGEDEGGQEAQSGEVGNAGHGKEGREGERGGMERTGRETGR
eukprot:jgi/Mesvir1/350/Mv22754-RA.1